MGLTESIKGVNMKPSPLKLKELHELSPAQFVDMTEYFKSNEYAIYKRRKQIMQARTKIELGVKDECPTITESR